MGNGIAMRAYPLTAAQSERRYASNASRARTPWPPPVLLIHASTQRRGLPISEEHDDDQTERTHALACGRRCGLYLPGREMAGDHRSPEADVEAAWDACRGALQDARPGPRGEGEDGVHEESGAGVALIFRGNGAMTEASDLYMYRSSGALLSQRAQGSAMAGEQGKGGSR